MNLEKPDDQTIRLNQVDGTGLVQRINSSSDNTDQGLAKLVLTLVELLRKLMEHEAILRIEGGTLTDKEIEEMGETFFKLDNKMKEMCSIFGLKEKELNLELGPLGNLM